MRYDELLNLISEFCVENQISVNVSQNMPEGYENAFGTYDVTVGTLYINFPKLDNAPEYKVMFYLYHELRHAVQYLHSERFDERIRQSSAYVVLFSGTCFKLVNNGWQQCRLEGTEVYFTDIYLGLPYERDANEFAYQQTAEFCGCTTELDKLYDMWRPKVIREDAEYQKVFCLIDSKVVKNKYLDQKSSERC